ncbi:MAG: E3 ubiquitin ligase family protein [Leptolyngbyaceae cyanobacterium]
MEFIGIFFLVVSGVMFFSRRSQQQKLFSLKRARAMTAAELAATAGAVAEEIGGGSWRDYIKLWGTVEVEHPLLSEHRQQPCVHFVSTVQREYETQDDDGKTKKVTKQISHNRQSINFWLVDDTGRVLVNPEGAAIETVQVMDELRPEPADPTSGDRYKESILPVGQNVLVVGAVSDLTGKVIIGKPTQADHHYVISLKDEEMLATATTQSARNMGIGLFVCLGIGLVLLIWGILS